MSEEEEIFSSAIKSAGIFNFKEFYQFCYDWLVEEAGLSVEEKNYKEKIVGDSKDIEVEWVGFKKVTDYFKYTIKIKITALNLKKVEAQQGNVKIITNKGDVKMKVTGILVRDYDGKFEKTGFQKMLRGIYDKWIIHSRIEQMENKLTGVCDTFVSQAKAFLDLEGKK